jgi:glycosyltransferase involved in cell wall biosynthesis
LGDDELPTVYAGAELFLFPSIYEGFGLPVAEAMACGTAVVCSHSTALPEVAGSAAQFVDPYNIESIAAGMRRLLDDTPARRALADQGIAQSKKFSWDAAAEATWRVFECVSC